MNDNKKVIVKNTNEQNQSQTQKSWMDKVLSFIEMIKYTIDGKYNISLKLKVFGILGLIYLISPIDIISDVLVPIGFVDDAAVLALLWKLISSEILNFENSKNQKFQENTDYEIIDK